MFHFPAFQGLERFGYRFLPAGRINQSPLQGAFCRIQKFPVKDCVKFLRRPGAGLYQRIASQRENAVKPFAVLSAVRLGNGVSGKHFIRGFVFKITQFPCAYPQFFQSLRYIAPAVYIAGKGQSPQSVHHDFIRH